MVSYKVLCICFILNLQVYLCKSKIRDLTSTEVDSFIKTLDIKVLYFERTDSQLQFPLFLQEYADAAETLHSYGVQLAKVNCYTDKHVYCSEPADPSLFIFKDSKLLKTIPLRRVSNEPSIVANILHRFVLKDELTIVQTEDDFKEILDKEKGKTNLILANVMTIGMKDHRNLLEVAFALGDSFKFYITTKLPINLYGEKSKIKVFLCKKKNCEVRHYVDNDFKIIALATFIQSVTLPGAIVLGEDEKIPYNTGTHFPINIVYIFEKNNKDIESTQVELEEVAKSMTAAVGIVIVQVEKHLRFIKTFGLADDSGYPALGFIPSYKALTDETMEHVDVFTSHDKRLKEKGYAGIIKDLIEIPAAVYGASVNTRSLTLSRPVEYVTIVNENEMQYLFVAFCLKDDDECESFKYEYQRLSRTFDRHFQRSSAGRRDMKFAFIVCDEDLDPKFNIKTYPTVRLHKKDESLLEFTPYTGRMNYYELLEFVKQVTGETYVLQLPSSGLDLIEMDSLYDTGENGSPKIYGEESEKSSEEWDDFEKPPEETEDDEVAAAGHRIFLTNTLNDEHVPKLNDTSFNTTIQQYDIAVVLFFLPWDARCQAFTPSYGAAAKALVNPDGSGKTVGVLEVDCYDWEDVCRKENIQVYPTVRIYRKMKSNMDYHGVLDEPSLVKTIKLLLSSSPVKLTSDGEAVGFEVGKFPMPSILFTDISVMGLFALESSDQVPIFQTAAMTLEGQDIFGYATGKVASETSSRLGVSIPSIVLIKRNDPLQNKVVYQGDYTVESILNFVKHSSLPLYGELSPVNFPMYFSRNQPFLLVFKQKENNNVDLVIADIIKSSEIKNINVCWVDVSLKVNRDILETYTKPDNQAEIHYPTVILVNHSEGKTYTYHDELNKVLLISWIKRCLNKLQDFTGELKQSEWKPRLEGYDFLAKIKEESEDNGEQKDPWSSTSSDNDNNEEEDYDEDQKDQTVLKKDKDHHNQRFHAAFHAKKQSRMNQRQQIAPETSHTSHNVHTEL